ncbi:MAG: hypothetical protein ACYTEZ_03000 [Planctomycetota bacterium]|jgi:hypothetical protein
MTDPRLRKKIRETKALASERGLDLGAAPLLVTCEMPIWGAAIATYEFNDLARLPGTGVAVMSTDPLPEVRQAVAAAPNLHVVAERGLVCGLSGGATLHVYPCNPREMEAFACALFAGVAPEALRIALSGFTSSGRQEVTFEGPRSAPPPTARELLHALRERDSTAAFAGESEDAVVVDDTPSELEAVRSALVADLPGRSVRVSRLPSGRFRFAPDTQPREVPRDRMHTLAQQIAMSSDRFVEVRGGTTFGFVTEEVARWEYGPEVGARRLAEELFEAPDTVITQLGLHPFTEEGTLFFAYEGSETVWEAANKSIGCITVRDILEYGRILFAIRRGE